jgi:hypothetical protein
MVDGHHKYLSSAHGEIQGQTAAAMILHCITQAHDTTNIPIQLVGDNQAVQNKCGRQTCKKLRSHRDPNSDLFTEYHAVASALRPTTRWVRSHQRQ